ncbi:Solute carrier organic anion transporter family member 5A1 [Hypsibius exemplaris]|uniref:Solute carrier organic anion transporter family member n=1 Tax=Hypsibius exemplaris TaxID=2072580 RepID=A0A1W0WJK9_HYPEX|nr:Solute carrier organic anion transporter family member 5A1 [Hypsibius exemplaris]
MVFEKIRKKYCPDGIQLRNPFASSLIDDLSCGIFGWRPAWLQCFRSMKVFMACYVVLGVFHGMYGSYLGPVIPSIEKRFGFTSKEVGSFRAMSDVSRILASLIVAHYGGAGHRPRWIGCGAILLGLGMFLMASTEVMFPVTSRSMVSLVVASASDSNERFCHSNPLRNATKNPCSQAIESSLYPLMVLGASEFIMGLGATSIVILALPFIDDNVSTRTSPYYFALSFCGRLFGPLFGFGLGAICTNIFFDFSHPNFKTNDPRWVSAWWLGLLVCSSGILAMGLILVLFPSVVRDTCEGSKDCKEFEAKRRASMARKCVSLKDFPRNIWRLCTNVPFMTKLVSQLLEALVISGYLNFLQKFIREQYNVSQSVASLATGIPGVFSAFLGIFIGSFLIKRFKMEPRHVSLLTAGAAIIGAAAYFIVIAFGCEQMNIIGIDDTPNRYNLSAAANAEMCFNQQNCQCPDGNFNPLCDTNTGYSYVSSCVAGCTSAKRTNTTKTYVGCSCLRNATVNPIEHAHWNKTEGKQPGGLIPGLCQRTCHYFAPYIVVMCLAKLFLGIPISGIVMMQFRLVDYDLKSLANGMSSVLMSLFGFLPAPIIAGAIIDTACRYWQKSPCGDKGSCLLYNADQFRWKLHIIVGCIKVVTCIMDLVIAWQVWDWKFDRDASPENKAGPGSRSSSIGSRTGSIIMPAITLQPEKEGLPIPEPEATVVHATPEPRRRVVGFAEDTISEKEAEDTVADLRVPPAPRGRSNTLGGIYPRRASLNLDWENHQVANLTNPMALTEDREELEDVPDMFIAARRGSLLF